MKIIRRTFEASKFPKGSPERTKLNMNASTSEYMTSHKYQLSNGQKFSSTYRTKKEAEEALKRMTARDKAWGNIITKPKTK